MKKNYLNKFDEIKKGHQKIVKDLNEEKYNEKLLNKIQLNFLVHMKKKNSKIV